MRINVLFALVCFACPGLPILATTVSEDVASYRNAGASLNPESGPPLLQKLTILRLNDKLLFLNSVEAFLRGIYDNKTPDADVAFLPFMKWLCSIKESDMPGYGDNILSLQGIAVTRGLCMEESRWGSAAQLEMFKTNLDFLAAIKSNIKPNFKPYPMTMNVAPPPGVHPGIVGMDPAAISDPKLRKQYEDAIRENSEHSVENNRQNMLSQVLHSGMGMTHDFLNKVATSNPDLYRKCESLMAQSKLEDKFP